MENRKKLNIITPLLILIIISLIIGIVSLFLSSANKKRAERIRDEYTQEARAYISKNQSGLKVLFTEVFPETECVVPQACTDTTQDIVMNLISDDLKDFSSTSFLRINTEGEVVHMYLNGFTWVVIRSDDTSYNSDEKLVQLLRGEVDEIPWDDYIPYRFTNKQVIVPVKDSDGRTLGAIMRAVIE